MNPINSLSSSTSTDEITIRYRPNLYEKYILEDHWNKENCSRFLLMIKHAKKEQGATSDKQRKLNRTVRLKEFIRDFVRTKKNDHENTKQIFEKSFKRLDNQTIVEYIDTNIHLPARIFAMLSKELNIPAANQKQA